MTKRAKSIQAFVAELTKLTIDALPIKMAIQGNNPTLTSQEAKEILFQCQLNLQAHLVEIVENNEEQAEALMAELGVKWKTPPNYDFGTPPEEQ